MSNDLIIPDDSDHNVDRMARFQSLQTGQYWRSLSAINEEGIEEGVTLLIQSIRFVEDAPHTIILRPHPSKMGKETQLTYTDKDGKEVNRYFRYKEHRFLLNDFLLAFEFEPDHQRIRSEEIRAVQGLINNIQTELLEAQSNPAILAEVVQAELEEIDQQKSETSNNPEQSTTSPSPAKQTTPNSEVVSLAGGTIANAIGTGITEEGIAMLKDAANREHQIATIKSQWIQGKTSEIAKTIMAMTPYYEEQAAAALAQTEDVRAYVTKLLQGIESLDLYVGKNVEVEEIRTGESADKNVPLTFVQKKLCMDEELAVWADVDEWFDFSKFELFFEALRKNDGLVNQIFPTERCVLVMASTRRDIDYGDKWSNVIRNNANKQVFLLVRDGMNIHRVYSPVESHLGTSRLFPSKNDQDNVFRGFDGSQVKFEDVAYTDRLAAHEQYALHFKRFLLLVCGLDHRLKLFGEFYEGPATLHFVSLKFQEQYCRFLHDDDGAFMLPTERRQPLKEWIAEKNTYLRSGARVLCNWFSVMNPDTASGACKTVSHGSRGYEMRYSPQERFGVAIAYRDGNSICVDVEVSGYSYSSGDRSFKCKVNLSNFRNGAWEYTDMPFLCLDAVQEDEVYWYIQNRDTRSNHIDYIRFFKHALKHLQLESEDEQDTRRRLADALSIGSFALPADRPEIINQAVIAWRAANRGKPLPKFIGESAPSNWKSLLDQMYMLAGEGQRRVADVEAFINGLGYQPLRLVLSGAAKLVVYAAPNEAELNNALEPHAWVHRLTIEKGKTRYLEKGRRWVLLPEQAASETTLHEWEDAKAWSSRRSAFSSLDAKVAIFSHVQDFKSALLPFAQKEMSEDEHRKYLNEWKQAREELNRKSSMVQEPTISIPFGISLSARTHHASYFCITTHNAYGLLYNLAPNDDVKMEIQTYFVKLYKDKEFAKRLLRAGMKSEFDWRLGSYSIDPARIPDSIYTGCSNLTNRDEANPLFSNWFENWLAANQKANNGKTVMWLADGVLDQDGKLNLDEIVGNVLPDDYEPVQVASVTVNTSDKQSKASYDRWFDIYPKIKDKKYVLSDLINSSEKIEKQSGLSCGYSAQLETFLSMSKAIEHVHAKITRLGGKCKAVPASEIPDAPQPPDGVSRWFPVEG